MKIAVAHGELGAWDGSSRYIADVAGLFARAGHEVSLICLRCTRELPADLAPRHPDDLLLGERFDLLYGSDLELLHALEPRADRFFYAPLDVFGSSHDLERWALERCDRLLRFTRVAVDILERTYGLELHAKSLVAVYVSRAFEDLPEPRWIRPAPPELLWVGRLIETKNVAFLIRAVAQLETPSWRLVLVGDGPERTALRQQVQRVGLTERVIFAGHVPDHGSHYATASLFLTASIREHYSLTLMEAAAHGVPILGLAPDGLDIINACDEQILDGRTGYVVRSERTMARRIDELLGNESTRQAMAHHAWQRKQAEFTWDQFCKPLLEALQA